MAAKIVLTLVLSLSLVACSVTSTKEGRQISMLPLVADKSRYLDVNDKNLKKAERLEHYSNQLSNFYDLKSSASIRVLPRPSYQTNDRFTPIPFMIYEIDSNPVRIIENTMFNPNNVRITEYAQHDLKIPSGEHDLIIINGLGNSRWFTKIEKINFEQDKKYVIGADTKENQKAKIFIAEYEIDQRFKSIEPEHFILKKRIVDGLEIGNLKNVRIY